MKIIIAILIVFLFSTCKQNTVIIHNYEYYKYQKIPMNGYTYNGNTIVLNNNKYLLRTIQIYRNDTLIGAGINKSEGVMDYSQKDLESDTLFFKSMNFSKHQTIVYNNNFVLDKGIKIYITGIKGDSIFYTKKDTLFLFKSIQ